MMGAALVQVADGCFDNYPEFKKYKQNYYKKSLFAPDNVDIHIVKSERGGKLIMFNNV